MSRQTPGVKGLKDGNASAVSGSDIYTGRVRVSGGELEYDRIGTAPDAGPAPLIFLHGWTLDRRMWAPQVAAFGDRPVIAVDRRGCGRSSAPFDLRREAEDVLVVADHLGLNSFILVGMSQAGQIAAEVALAHPSRLAGLVFQGVRLGPVGADSHPDIPLDTYRDLVRSGRLDAMKALWRDHPLMRPADPARQAAIDAMLDGYGGGDLLADTRPGAALQWDALSKMETPALIVTGDRETELRRSVARRLGETLPDATCVEIETAGHMCNLCRPAPYNAALQAFIERL